MPGEPRGGGVPLTFANAVAGEFTPIGRWRRQHLLDPPLFVIITRSPVVRDLALNRGEYADDFGSAIAPTISFDQADAVMRGILVIKESGEAQHPRNVFGVVVAAIARHHPFHDGGEVSSTLFVSRPITINEPIAVKLTQRALDDYRRR